MQLRLLGVLGAVALLAWALYGVQPEGAGNGKGVKVTIKDGVEPIVRPSGAGRGSAQEAVGPHAADPNAGGAADAQAVDKATGKVVSVEDGMKDAPPGAGLIRQNSSEMRPGDWARVIISSLEADDGNTGLEDIYRNAQTFADQGKPVDAYLLHFYAARRGYAPSAMVLASIADPASYRPDNGMLDEPDPGEAIKWYKVAAKGGEKEAGARLDALKKRLEEQARDGDQAAQRLLLQFQ